VAPFYFARSGSLLLCAQQQACGRVFRQVPSVSQFDEHRAQIRNVFVHLQFLTARRLAALPDPFQYFFSARSSTFFTSTRSSLFRALPLVSIRRSLDRFRKRAGRATIRLRPGKYWRAKQLQRQIKTMTMCSTGFLRNAARRAKLAFFSSEPREATSKQQGQPACAEPWRRLHGVSSIEYREAHRGYLVRASSNESGSFSLSVEGPNGRVPSPLSERLAVAGCSPSRRFSTVHDAIDATARAKNEIDRFLASVED
jgi:hypothetical protein